ncbi:MAG: hypothetical protein ACLRFL_01970 [Clostridia bacterium]
MKPSGIIISRINYQKGRKDSVKENLGRVKLVIFLAILAVLALVGTLVFQLVSIHKNNEIIKTQQAQIEELKQQLEYYENNGSNYNGDEIIVGD